jgi:hypothetical protein
VVKKAAQRFVVCNVAPIGALGEALSDEGSIVAPHRRHLARVE